MSLRPVGAAGRATMQHSQQIPAHSHSGCHGKEPAGAGAPSTVTDPVCGMVVNPTTAAHRAEHGRETYCFCSAGCRAKFVADPEKYLAPERTEVAPMVVPGTMFICPMHPQIRQAGPGNCPICGMALEPETVSLEDKPNPELADMTRRFWIGGALALPILLLEMGGHVPGLGLSHLIPVRVSLWIQFLLGTPVVLWAGWPFFERAWQSVANRSLNMFSLIALGTGAAYLFSLVAFFAPQLFPAGFRSEGGFGPVYFEAAAVITVLVLLGQVLELRARERTGDAIRALLNLAPKTARRIAPSGEEEEVPVTEVQVGERLRVRPGDSVAVDGRVVEGQSVDRRIDGDRRIDARREGSR